MNRILHNLIQLSMYPSHSSFSSGLRNLKEVQLEKIGGDYEKFIQHNPISTYADFEPIALTILNEKKIHCVPTSGSTSKIKWIPYTKEFKTEIWNAMAPWIYDVYRRYPGVKNGKHFWSLSWLPDDLRQTHHTDDLEFVSILEKILMQKTMAVDSQISHAPSLNQALHLSAQALANQKISLISVWSPTFLLELVEILFEDKNILETNLNDRARSILNNHSVLTSDFCREMWPDLKLISSWDTSTSKYYAEKIKTLFPQSQFQGKGLWATEGVVSIPFDEKFLLAYRSHFYEFECVETKKIYPAWKCERDMVATVLLTTASGLRRYRLNDRVKIYGNLNGVPCIEFLGRENVIDLVGEKLSLEVFQNVLNEVNKKFKMLNAVSFLAQTAAHPYYELLVESESQNSELEAFVESQLLEHFHYRLARETMQLQKVKIKNIKNAKDYYFSIASKDIKIKGNIKIEPALLIKDTTL